jgi:peptidoglycan/xylan/chitin deacetylase (PgdA/CDA1 family)
VNEVNGPVSTPRRAFVEALKHVWYYAGLAGLARQLGRGYGAILRYHSVTGDEDATLTYLDRGLMVTSATFRTHLRFVRRYYTALPLDDMVDAIHAGRPLPPRAVAITFDDGYLDNFTHAYPLLRAEGLPATFYVTTGTIDGGPPLWTAKLRFMVRTTTRRQIVLPAALGAPAELPDAAARQALFTRLIVALKNVPSEERCRLVDVLADAFDVHDFTPLARIMMTWEQLREMSRNGMTIGAHTVSHPNLPRTEVEEQTREVCGSRDTIAAELRVPVAHFSYPNGRGASHVNETVREVVRRAGFRSAVTSLAGPVAAGADPWGLRRVGVYYRHADLRSFSLDVERARLRRS